MYDYRFKEEDAYRFANAIGSRSTRKNGQLEFLFCPYCNGGSSRDKRTFHISLQSGQFECKRSSCGVTGNMITLAKDFSGMFDLGNDVASYYNINGFRDKMKRFKDDKKVFKSKDPAINYMLSRGISEATTRKHEITTTDKDNVIVFPFKDEEGSLRFVKYRNIDPNRTGPKEWCVKGNFAKILFGMNHCEDFTTLVITEGQIDSLTLAECGVKNAVSVPTGKNGFTWKPIVWDWLVKFDEIVVFGDNENGEITLAKEITGFFPKRVRVVSPEAYKGCKDANELYRRYGKDSVLFAIATAEPKVSLRIKNLSDVEEEDLSTMEAYPTKVVALDDAIGRGFHAGELVILTGKCGEGKSTFASQIVGRMIQNGLKCFCYSGELPDYVFKAWLNYQLAGSKKLTAGSLNKLNDWYRDKCYIYDNSSIIDEKEELFDVMGQAVKDLGCKFILIDNLMTAMDDKPTEDLFRQQSKFIGQLTKFCKGFNVVIMLVAHPKKGDSYENDSISGSGDITNRADLVIRYQRAKRDAKSEYHSKLLITKNRTTGKLDYDGIDLEYLPDSMRIKEYDQSAFEEFIGEDVVDFTECDYDEIPFD